MLYQSHTPLSDFRADSLSSEAASRKIGQLNWPFVRALVRWKAHIHVQSLLWVVNRCWEQVVLRWHLTFIILNAVWVNRLRPPYIMLYSSNLPMKTDFSQPWLLWLYFENSHSFYSPSLNGCIFGPISYVWFETSKVLIRYSLWQWQPIHIKGVMLPISFIVSINNSAGVYVDLGFSRR